MALNGSLVRCVKHPSHLSPGFCSLCLIERLSIVGLTKDGLEEDPIHSSNGCEILEVAVATPKLEERKEKPKTTLLALFELDDLKNGTTTTRTSDVGSERSLKSASLEVKYRMRLLKWRRRSSASVDRKELQPRTMESPREMGRLRRSSSLRCACEWIACCNNSCDSTHSASSWSRFWEGGGTIFPLGLKRSLSESGNNDRRSFGDPIDSRSERIDPNNKKKWMFGRSFSLRSASTCSSSDNKSSKGPVC